MGLCRQMLESKYMMNMDNMSMTPFNRIPDTSRQQQQQQQQQHQQQQQQPMNIPRQDSFRNNYANSGMSSRAMSTNSGHFSNSDMNLLNQGISRVNMNFNAAPNMMNQQNNPYNIRPNANANGFNGMHNSNSNINNNSMNNNNNNNGNNNNINSNSMNNNNNNSNLILNNNGGVDVRQNFAGMPNVFGRSLSKPPIFSLNNSGMNWHTDPSTMSPNGAIPDMSQLRLAKNMSCPAMPDKLIAIVIKKVQHVSLFAICSCYL